MSNITKYEQQSKDLDTLKAMALVAVNSGKYSPEYNQATVLNIFMTARALGVDPMLALNGGFNIIKGKINMGAHFMSALARRAGHSLKIIEMSDQKCIIIAKRKDNEDSLKYEMTMDEANRAGLTGKQNWQSNPKQMLYCACVRNVFRILFSDIAIPYDADEMNVEDETMLEKQAAGSAEVIETITTEPESEIIDCRPNKAHSEPKPALEPFQQLEESLKSDKIASERLKEWLQLQCQSKGIEESRAIGACLNALPAFKKSFVKWLKASETIQEVSA